MNKIEHFFHSFKDRLFIFELSCSGFCVCLFVFGYFYSQFLNPIEESVQYLQYILQILSTSINLYFCHSKELDIATSAVCLSYHFINLFFSHFDSLS